MYIYTYIYLNITEKGIGMWKKYMKTVICNSLCSCFPGLQLMWLSSMWAPAQRTQFHRAARWAFEDSSVSKKVLGLVATPLSSQQQTPCSCFVAARLITFVFEFHTSATARHLALWRMRTDNALKNEQTFPQLLGPFNNLILANQTERSQAVCQTQAQGVQWSTSCFILWKD